MLTGSSSAIPLSSLAAEALLTTPGPKSTRYALPLTTTAVAEPDLSGSGCGVPVPSRTSFVEVSAKAAVATVRRAAKNRVFKGKAMIGLSPGST